MELVIDTPVGKFVAEFTHDTLTKGYTGICSKYPNVIAEGDDLSECITNLSNLLEAVFEFEKTKS